MGVLIADLTMAAWVQLGVITLLASTLQGATGFGLTLLSLPFFLAIIGSGEAVQILILINLMLSMILARHLKDDLPRPLFVTMGIGAVVGLPLGLVAFAYANLDHMKLAAAAGVLIFTAVLVRREGMNAGAKAPGGGSGPIDPAFRRRSASAMGAAAGAMTTSLGMPGPALVLYCSGIGLAKARFRAVSLTLFLFLYTAALLLQAVTVGVGAPVWRGALILLPITAVGAGSGHQLAKIISEEAFRVALYLLLTLAGGYGLISALFI